MSVPLAIFDYSFSPYYISRLRALASRFPGMVAIQLYSRSTIHPWQFQESTNGFELQTLMDGDPKSFSSSDQRAAVRRILDRILPKMVCIGGAGDVGMREAAAWARRRHIPCIAISATNGLDRKRFWLTEALKSRWYRRYCDAFFLPGERSVAHFRGLGIAEDRIWRVMDVVDNAFFETRAAHALARDHEERSIQGLPDHYFLSVARLSKEKNFPRLLSAFKKYRISGGEWDFVIVGSGPEERPLKHQVAKEEIGGVHFVGWKDPKELAIFFGLASCFVLASLSETWGLVVNEAMASGLPVLISRKCGCLPDLCWKGINGYDFDPTDLQELTFRLLQMSSGKVDLRAMGRASKSIIANYSPENWALSLLNCVETTASRFRQGRTETLR